VSTKGGGKDVTEVLHTMLRGDDRAAGQLLRYLLLILGPAASGKTTLLKTFVMEIVHQYTDFVPVIIPIIEVLPVLLSCDRDAGESVVAAFVQRKYPQHAHLLLQAMLQRRAVFFIDGIDESGTQQDAVQDFVTVELLEPGYKTVITSRHSGFSGERSGSASWWNYCHYRTSRRRGWCAHACPMRRKRSGWCESWRTRPSMRSPPTRSCSR
jgi:predicted NACHT family NTPase